MSLMSLGLVRGLVGQVLGTLAGMIVVMLIRIAAGMPAYSEESVWVIGMLVGGIGFMIGVGAMDDWFQWWKGKETPFRHGPPHGLRMGHERTRASQLRQEGRTDLPRP